jgi:hypothetical protein
MSIVLQSSGGGSVTINEPTTASNFTATMPAATGTVMVSGNQPAFSAYANASQSVSSNVFTKISFQLEDFDTNNNFDSTTNYRFTPTVAGYYEINSQLYLAGTVTTTQLILALYKNGSIYQRIIDTNPSASLSSNSSTTISGSILVYMNGSTDFLEIYGYYYLGTSTFSQNNSTITSRFNGCLVRAA